MIDKLLTFIDKIYSTVIFLIAILLPQRLLTFIDKNIRHLYWRTLRMSKRNFDSDEDNLNPKLKNHWWTRGIEVAMVVTTRCNLHCNYCPMFYGKEQKWDGKYPRYEECTLEEWKEWFERFPFWISQVYITGGEPTLISWIGELVNWLVDRGHHVIMFSNLRNPEPLYVIKKSFRFVYYPTFHQNDISEDNFKKPFCDDENRFRFALLKLKNNTDFRIIVKELHPDKKFTGFKKLWGSFAKSLYVDDWFFNHNALFHFPPDAPKTGVIFWGCIKTYLGGK